MAGSEGSVGFFPIMDRPEGLVAPGQHYPVRAVIQAPMLVLHGHHTEVVRSVQCAAGAVGQKVMERNIWEALESLILCSA
jgi:hypothetical protein